MGIGYFFSDASSSPTCVLRGPSWAQSLQYNQKDQFIVAAGNMLAYLEPMIITRKNVSHATRFQVKYN